MRESNADLRAHLEEAAHIIAALVGDYCEQRDLAKKLEKERDEAQKHPGRNDPRVAAINDAVTDFITRKDNPRLVCYHVPMLGCEVLMFAVGEGLPKAVAYAQFIRTLERSAGIEG
jgi:hypothetical protein